MDRPRCMYQMDLRGTPVCSEEHQHRDCPYPCYECGVKRRDEKKHDGN